MSYYLSGNLPSDWHDGGVAELENSVDLSTHDVHSLLGHQASALRLFAAVLETLHDEGVVVGDLGKVQVQVVIAVKLI